MDYRILEFRYIDKKTKEIKSIYAQDEEVANYIIGLYNQLSAYNYVKKYFGFKKKVYVSMEPNLLVTQEIDTAQQLLISRAEEQGSGVI